MTEYRQEDRTMLGEPPWQPTAPALIDWESAHGHDVRLDCSLDGCKVLVAAYLAAVEALERLIDLIDSWDDSTMNRRLSPRVDDARAALRRLRDEVPA